MYFYEYSELSCLLGPDAADELQEADGFDTLQWGLVSEGLDPHVIGLARKSSSSTGAEAASSGGAEEGISGLKGRTGPRKGKGFA